VGLGELFLCASAQSGGAQATPGRGGGRIVVANRGSLSLSVIDVRTDQVIDTVPMPDGGEPMYLAYSPQRDRLFVVDRANQRVVIFHARDLELEATVPAGEGAFHCWIDPGELQAWITNDVDNTVTVIDTVSLEVLATIPMPADLVAAGYKNHDVNVSLRDRNAYVTMILAGQPAWLLQYSTQTFQQLGARQLGGDLHVSLRPGQPDLVFAMSQDAGLVSVLRADDLSDFAPPMTVTGAHGAVMNRRFASDFFYTTNFPGGGPGGIVTVDPQSFHVVATTDTPQAGPHNMAVVPSGRKLYLTHSGAAASTVSVYTLDRTTGIPALAAELSVGLNPFGLTHVP
jgi:YVTN family beta-propeller protein